MSALAAAAILLWVGALAPASDPAPPDSQPAPVETAAGGGGEEVICKREPVTGSRLARKKICMTAQEWATLRQASRDVLEDSNRRGLATCVPVPGSGTCGN